MTEAELQRLAEIMVKVSASNTDLGLSYWRMLGGFVIGVVTGVLVNIASDLIRARFKRETDLKTARVDLYQSLERYKHLFGLGLKLEKGGIDPESYTDNFWERYNNARERVRADLISVDDQRYTRLVARVLLWNGGDLDGEAKLRELRKITTQLRREVSPLLERLEEDDLMDSLFPPKRPWWRFWAR